MSFVGDTKNNAFVEKNKRRTGIRIDLVTFDLATIDCSCDFDVVPFVKFMFQRKRRD